MSINLDTLKVRTKSSYEFSTDIVVPLPEATLLAISNQAKDSGLIYSPMVDDNITANLSAVLEDEGLNAKFAGLAKKKGFERSSTGLSVSTKNISISEKTHTITVSMTRTKG